jgi:hypothetical protein
MMDLCTFLGRVLKWSYALEHRSSNSRKRYTAVTSSGCVSKSSRVTIKGDILEVEINKKPT